MMFVAGGALVVAATVLISGLAGALVGVLLLTYGLWRAIGLIQTWRREGSDPNEPSEPRQM